MRRRLFLCTAAVVVKLLVPAPAHAGTYDVVACDAAPGGVNNSWAPSTSGGTRMRAMASCPSTSSPATGLVASNRPGAGPPAWGEQAWLRFWAPAGAKVVSLTYTGGFWRPGTSEPGADDYQAEIAALGEGYRVDGCVAKTGTRCVQWNTGRSIPIAAENGVALVASCWGLRCRDGVGAPLAEWGNVGVSVRLRSASVRVSDGTAPAIAVDGPSGWVRGTRSVAWSASDNVGLRVVRASVGGAAVGSVTHSCDYTRAAPCPAAPTGAFEVDTTALADGERMLRVEGVDAAANTNADEVPLRVDNTPPEPTVSGAGQPGVPHPRPAVVRLAARDAASGMGGPGHLAYRIDDNAWATIAGDEGDVPVSGPGRHTLAYYAVDAAGNRSAVRTVSVTIAGPVEASPRPRAVGFTASAAHEAEFTAAKRFGEPCPAEATLRASRDASLVEVQPASAFGGAATLAAAPAALVGFELPAAPDCEVGSARLRLYATSGAGRRVSVARASSAWTEGSVVWRTRPDSVGVVSGAVAVAGWAEWDVTAQVAAMYRLGDSGLRLDAAEPVEFCAREASAPPCAGRAAELIVRFAE